MFDLSSACLCAWVDAERHRLCLHHPWIVELHCVDNSILQTVILMLNIKAGLSIHISTVATPI